MTAAFLNFIINFIIAALAILALVKDQKEGQKIARIVKGSIFLIIILAGVSVVNELYKADGDAQKFKQNIDSLSDILDNSRALYVKLDSNLASSQETLGKSDSNLNAARRSLFELNKIQSKANNILGELEENSIVQNQTNFETRKLVDTSRKIVSELNRVFQSSRRSEYPLSRIEMTIPLTLDSKSDDFRNILAQASRIKQSLETNKSNPYPNNLAINYDNNTKRITGISIKGIDQIKDFLGFNFDTSLVIRVVLADTLLGKDYSRVQPGFMAIYLSNYKSNYFLSQLNARDGAFRLFIDFNNNQISIIYYLSYIFNDYPSLTPKISIFEFLESNVFLVIDPMACKYSFTNFYLHFNNNKEVFALAVYPILKDENNCTKVFLKPGFESTPKWNDLGPAKFSDNYARYFW